jgi:hypothetical protein
MSAVYRATLEKVVRRGFPLGRRASASRARARPGSRRARCSGHGAREVVVIGGGFAGMAAATALQERRHEVVLLERRGILGGRATSYRDALSGEDVDNGTHLMIGAYTATLDLVDRAAARDLPAWCRTTCASTTWTTPVFSPSTARPLPRRSTSSRASSACACRGGRGLRPCVSA